MINNSFCEMAIKSKVTADYYLKIIGCILLTLVGFVSMLFIGGLSLLLVVGGIYLLTIVIPEKDIEYEYTLTDGSIEIAAIYNASRRKELFAFDLEKVSMIVPKNSLRISNESFIKKRDYSSKTDNENILSFVVETDKGKQLVVLEPNEVAMDHIKMHARNKIYKD